MNRPSRIRSAALLALLLAVCAAALPAAESMESWRKRFDGAGLCVGINPLNPNTVVAEEVAGQLSISYDRGATWHPWGSTGMGLIRQIVIHPTDTMTVLCASGSPSLKRSTNYGLTWDVVIDNFGIDGESISYDPMHPDTMYAGNFVDGKVFRSVNRGASWTLMGLAGPPGTANLCALAVRPDSANILYAGSGGGRISKSTDFGATWRIVKNGTAPVNVFQETPRIVVHPLAPLVAYATTYGDVDSTLDVWKSVDGGEHWERTGLRSTPTWSLEFDPLDPDVVYAGSFSDAAAAVYKTSDGGVTWSSLGAGLPPGGYMWNMKIHPLDPTVVWLSATIDAFSPNGLHRLLATSTILEGYLVDGATADTVSNGRVQLLSTGDESIITPAGRKFRFGFFEGDPTLTPALRAESYPFGIADALVSFTSGSLVSQDLVLERLATSAIGGRVADSVSHEPVAAAVHLFVERSIGDTVLTDSTDANGEFLFPGMYVSSPPVNSYARLQFDAPPPYATATISPVTLGAIDLSLEVPLGNADVFLVSISDSGLYLDYFHSALRALNVSANVWDIARRGPAPLSKGREFGFRTAVLYTGDLAAPLAAEMLDSIAACVGSGGSVFLTGQNIAEFNAGSPLFSSTLGVGFAGNTSIAFNQGVAGDILQGFSCFTTGSGANNQVSRDSLLPLRPGVHRVLDYGSGTGRAAALRVDSAGPGGAKAVVMGFGFEAIHTAAKRQALMLSVLNYFRGLTAMEHAGAAAVPAGFALEQNFPNPFNPATTIRFRVPQAARVTLELFDAAGRKIALLVDERVERGEHAVPWSGAGLASGVYYCRLQAYDGAAASPRYTETRKLLLLQ